MLCIVLGMFLAAGSTTLDGVYSLQQAERGESTFRAACQSCHSYGNLGGPEAQSLKGSRFIEAWREDTLESLFTKMSQTMPKRADKLQAEEYVDIIAYLLQANDFPQGPQELSASQLATIELVGKNGPQPLPNGAIVKTNGCVTPGPNNSWTLTRATEAMRPRREPAARAAGRFSCAETD